MSDGPLRQLHHAQARYIITAMSDDRPSEDCKVNGRLVEADEPRIEQKLGNSRDAAT